jgi:hypothetical protein
MIQQSLCYLRNIFDRLIKDWLIDPGRLAVAADLPYKLQRRRTDFLLCGGDFCIS